MDITASAMEECDACENGPAVLHVYAFFWPDYTGDGIYFESILRRLDADGANHAVLVTVTPAPSGAPKANGGRRQVHYLGGMGRAEPARLLWWVLKHGRRYRVVHLHCHVDRTFLSYLLFRLLGCRLVLSSTLDDAPGELLASYRPAKRLLVARLFRLIDAFVAISPKLFRDSVAAVPEDRVHLVPQGVARHAPACSRRAARRRLGIAEDALVLLSVASLVPRKNPLFLVAAMPHVLRRCPNALLVLSGPELDRDYGDRVHRQIAALGIAGRVMVTGFTDAPATLYEMCDLFVSSSLNEGFGNTVLEAMAASRPVVVRRLEGVNDAFIRSGETGFLFDDLNGYLAAVGALAADPALRRRIGGAARDSAEADFSLAAVAERYGQLYAELAGAAEDPSSGASHPRRRWLGRRWGPKRAPVCKA